MYAYLRPSEAHVKVVLDPGVNSFPVLEPAVTVRVPTRKVLLRHPASLDVRLWREILGDACQGLVGRVQAIFQIIRIMPYGSDEGTNYQYG